MNQVMARQNILLTGKTTSAIHRSRTSPPAEAPPVSPLLTERALADYLGVSVKTLRTWRYEGRLDGLYVRVGRAVRFRTSDLDELLRAVGGDQ